ncbi:uncharacterized protein LOC125371114 [Ricinus communis]|uniref:uncharacterized protein LOC125371114 n=1 Tax=Ricinus communis TaxID=3988 RepID=UPI00201A3350|nr:uncharacterized protein LOC125371114 [Ricinus communis]
MSDNKTLTKIPHFNGHDDHWSELMENLLRVKGVWSLVENGFTEPRAGTVLTGTQKMQLVDARTKDYQVKHYLFQAIDRTIFEQILDRKTTKKVWDSMKQKFGGNDKVNRSPLNLLRRDFEVSETKNDESITEYFTRVMTISNKMRSNRKDMLDSKIVEKILRTLIKKFTLLWVSSEYEDQVLKVDSGSRIRSRGRSSPRGRGRGKGRTTFNKYECPSWNKEANHIEVEEEDEDELLLMAYEELHEDMIRDA